MKYGSRRKFLSATGLSAGLGIFGSMLTRSAHAHHTDTHFEEKSSHRLVYQCNKADHDYIDHILFSCGEMLRKYGDEIELVVATFGPGVNLLVKTPRRAIYPKHSKQVQSLITYGVNFHACGNTMKSMHWTEDDLIEGVKVTPVGVDGIMKLQEQGFSYIAM